MKDTLRVIVLKGATELGEQVNYELQKIRKEKKSYIVPIVQSRFTNGEGKVVIAETIRKKDVYLLVDISNYSCTYPMFDYVNHYSPDEYFQDVKRVISAMMGHASSITVIMPLLYASRQHRRKGRESLDCAMALQELQALGVDDIVTFDVHDPNIQNAVPNMAFENFYPTHTIISSFIERESLDYQELLVVSPDMGAMDRARYYADILETDVGMFYKRRDLSKVVDGKNPIVAHEYLGKDVKEKTVFVVDDMIASGDSILEVSLELKKRGAKKIYLVATFALFTAGIKRFEQYYEDGYFDRIYATNLCYVPKEALQQEWFVAVDCASFVAEIIDTLNKHESISPLMNGKKEIIERIRNKKMELS